MIAGTKCRDESGHVGLPLQTPEALDGFEATTVIRSAERETGSSGQPRLPIVALTAHAMHGDRQRCLDAGMDDYVSKPIKPADLFDAIERVLTATPRA